MSWYTLNVTATGECKGHTSVQPDPLKTAPSLTTITHSNRLDQNFLWNTASRAWDIPKPIPVLVDRLQDIADIPFMAEIWTTLSAAQRTKLRKLIVWLIASRRYRQQLEAVSIDSDDAWPNDPSGVTP
jgi:hypothetical protein